MFTAPEAQAAIELLGRVSITGHQERGLMNLICGKLDLVANPPAPKVVPVITPTSAAPPTSNKKRGRPAGKR